MGLISQPLTHIHISAQLLNDRKELSVKGICNDLSCEVDILKSLYHLERETNMDKATSLYTVIFFNLVGNIKIVISIIDSALH